MVRPNCTSIASASASFPRLHPLQLVAPWLCPLQRCSPNCCSLSVSACYHTHAVQSIHSNNYEGHTSLPQPRPLNFPLPLHTHILNTNILMQLWKGLCRGVVCWTVFYYHPHLVFLLFAFLLSLHFQFFLIVITKNQRDWHRYLSGYEPDNS